MSAGNPNSAGEDLLEGLPETQTELLRRAEGLRGSGELESARRLLGRALDRTDSPELRRAYGRVANESGAPGDARDTVRPLCEKSRPDSEALLISARAHEKLGEDDAARQALSRAERYGAPESAVRPIRERLDGEPSTGREDLRSTTEREGVESEENPFEEMDDTVIDRTVSPPERPSGGGSAATPPPTPPDSSDGASGEPTDRPEPDPRAEGRLPDRHSRDGGVPESADSSSGAADDTQVDAPSDVGPPARPDAPDGGPEPGAEIDRGADPPPAGEPTRRVGLGAPDSDATGDEQEPTKDIEFGTTSASEQNVPEEFEGERTTIEVDESLQNEAESMLRSGAGPVGTAEEFEVSTDPEVPHARMRTEDSGDPEHPTEESRDPLADAETADRSLTDVPDNFEDEPPTDPAAPEPSTAPGTVEEDVTTDPLRSSAEQVRAGRGHRDPADEPTGESGGGPRASERSSRSPRRSSPAAGPQTTGPDDSPSGPRSSGGLREERRRAQRPAGRLEDGDERENGSRRAGSGAPSGPDEHPERGPAITWPWLLGATVSAVLLFSLAAAGLVSTYDADHLASTLERVETDRARDTYRGWRESLADLSRASTGGFPQIRGVAYAFGAPFSSRDPGALRAELLGRHAHHAAAVEYRFESFGSRNSSEIAERAFREDRDSPLAAAAEIYRLLARGKIGRAVERGSAASSRHDDRQLAVAHLHALLEAGRSRKIVSRADEIRERRSELDVHERYVLALAAMHDEDRSATAELETLIEQYSPDHLDAKIDRVRASVAEGRYDRATAVGGDLVENHSDTASPYQRTRLRTALGDAFRALGQTKRAEEQYRRALESQPERTDAHLPLVDLLIAEGRLDRAREQLRLAGARARVTPGHRVRRARIDFLAGRFRAALDHLAGLSASAVGDPVLRGRILVELGEHGSARSVLNTVPPPDGRYPAAKSLELLARARMGIADSDALFETFDQLRSRSPEDPLVLRSEARVHLQFATETEGTTRRRHLDRARRLLDRASEAGPERAVHLYLLCELHLLAERAAEASDACRKARQKNDDYLPGLLTVAELYLAKGEIARAENLTARLADEYDDRWDVAALRIRSAVRVRKLEDARDLMERWRGRPAGNSAEFELYEGLADFARADYDRAADHFEAARESPRHQREATLYFTHSLARLGKLERAEELIRDLTRSSRWRAPAWLIFAEIRRRQGRRADALENLELAERHFRSGLAPDWRIAHLHAERAWTEVDRHGWDDPRVFEHLERGRAEGNAQSPDLQLPLGLYYLRRPDRDLERAATHLQNVVDLQPYRCEAHPALVEAYRELGRPDARNRVSRLERENCQ